MTTTRTSSTKSIRTALKAAGLSSVIVRSGKGCRKGTVHVYMTHSATRMEREAVAAFLVERSAVVLWGGPVSVVECRGPLEFFDSVSVVSMLA